MHDEHRNDGENRFGRISELRLKATARDGVTAVPELYASMPFKVMIRLMCASAIYLATGALRGKTTGAASSRHQNNSWS